MGGLLPLDREQHRRRGGDGHRQDNRAGAAGQRRHAVQVLTGEAQHKADEHQPRHNAAFARGRDDDGQKHAVQRHAQRADDPQRQQVARHDAQRRADSPSGRGQQNGAVGVIRVQAAGPGNRDAEQLVRHIVADEQPMKKTACPAQTAGPARSSSRDTARWRSA